MIGKQIAQARQNKNLTQNELAKLLSITRSAVAQWETEREEPTLKHFVDLCNTLELDPTALLKEYLTCHSPSAISRFSPTPMASPFGTTRPKVINLAKSQRETSLEKAMICSQVVIWL